MPDAKETNERPANADVEGAPSQNVASQAFETSPRETVPSSRFGAPAEVAPQSAAPSPRQASSSAVPNAASPLARASRFEATSSAAAPQRERPSHDDASHRPAGAQRPRPDRQPFVRQRAPHLTQPPVNDTQVDEEIGRDFPHESSYTLSRRNPLGSHTYRRSRSNVSRVKQELKYGQYLSVPKGNHEIFSSRDRVRRHQLLVALVAVIIIAVIVALFLMLTH